MAPTSFLRDEDWLANWTGLIIVGLTYAFVTGLGPLVVLLPAKWTIGTGFPSLSVGIGTLIASIVVILVSVIVAMLHRSKKIPEAPPILQFITVLICIVSIAFICLWLGRSRMLSSIGLGYALWSILVGALLSNLMNMAGKGAFLDKLKVVTKREGWFIKTGLVLLGVDLRTLGVVGLPGFLVSYLVPPIIIVTIYQLGTRFFKVSSKTLVITVAAGCAVCGNSAASAAAAACGAPSDELPLALGILNVFTTIFMLIEPYFAILVKMDHIVAGAWIGGSVDHTGQVLAAASIVSPESETVAGIIKILQNTLIGFVALVISFYWTLVVEKEKEDIEMSPESDIPIEKPSKIAEIARKFPMFTLGFFLHSILLTLLLNPTLPPHHVTVLSAGTKSMSSWMFATAFVCIGLEMDIKKLKSQLKGGGIVYAYVMGQFLDIGVTYLMSWVAFSGVLFNRPVL